MTDLFLQRRTRNTRITPSAIAGKTDRIRLPSLATHRVTLCIYIMRYEWDGRKNLRNQQLHGISFELAALVFEDEDCLVYPDRIDARTGEPRWHALGTIPIEPEGAAVVVVVHVYREEQHGEEIVRIISARAAEKNELRRYQRQALD